MGDKSSVGDVSLALIGYERKQAADIDIPGIRTTSSTISMFTLDNFLHLLCAKKRGQFPTTMQTLEKVSTIQQWNILFTGRIPITHCIKVCSINVDHSFKSKTFP